MAAILILLLAPFLIFVSISNFFLGLPVFFVHLRPGKDEKLFGLVKFCTINPENGGIGTFSNMLRKSSLDELPQLWNILKGEMSFVGPRPLLIEYLKKYTIEQHQRHSIKPGITGLAQINGRNELTLDEKIELDLNYLNKISFQIDVLILFKTFLQIFKFDQADGHVKSKELVN